MPPNATLGVSSEFNGGTLYREFFEWGIFVCAVMQTREIAHGKYLVCASPDVFSQICLL